MEVKEVMARDPWSTPDALGERNHYERPVLNKKAFAPAPDDPPEQRKPEVPLKPRPEPDLSQAYTEDRGLLDFLNKLLQELT